MASKMEMAKLNLLEEETENSQRVAVLNEPYDLSVHYAEIPEPQDDEIRVKIKYVGICGSDLEAYRGTRDPEFVSTPARLGHEVAGVIDKVGSSVQGLKEGDRVTCRYVWGAYAEYIVCKPFNVKKLPPDFPMKEISLLEILPGVIHTAELSKIDSTTDVLVMGQGVSGLVITQVLNLYSPNNLVVTDLYDKNLKLAQKYGATQTYKIPDPDTATMDVVGEDFPDGFDVVIPCLLEGDGMVDAIDCCNLGARLVMYGCIGVCNEPIDFFRVHRKRLEIYSTEPRRDIDMRRFFNEGIEMAKDGLVNTTEFVTHVLGLSKIDKAFEIRNKGDKDTIHVLIDCEE
ncbi:MAG: zinc-dependent alcohol dehydrogenase [Bacillota bacterium]